MYSNENFCIYEMNFRLSCAHFFFLLLKKIDSNGNTILSHTIHLFHINNNNNNDD